MLLRIFSCSTAYVAAHKASPPSSRFFLPGFPPTAPPMWRGRGVDPDAEDDEVAKGGAPAWEEEWRYTMEKSHG